MKPLTRDQLASRKAQAVRFVRNVLGDPDRADEIEAESLEGYAERRKVKLLNPPNWRNAIMATKAELEGRIDELEQENADLQDQLDAIADIVAPADEDEIEDEDSDSDDDDSGNGDDDNGDDDNGDDEGEVLD